jgi:hypothetical protein
MEIKTKEIRANNRDFIDVIRSLEGPFIYRGQPVYKIKTDNGIKELKLIPKIARDKNGDIIPIRKRETVTGEIDIVNYKENIVLNLLSKRLPSYDIKYFNLNSEKSMKWDKLFVAQHYGIQTRLLDFTINPLVAYFFAVNNYFDYEGVVYCLRFDEKNYKLLDDLRREDYRDLKQSIIISPPHIDERVRVQNSVFVCFKDPRIPLDEQEDFFHDTGIQIIRIIIPNEEKHNILKDLNVLGINHESLFPDLTGSGKFINWFINTY